MERPIRIMICEDQEKWRKAIRAELSAFNVLVLGEASNGAELLVLLESLRPDVVLLDLNMPVMDGNETASRLCEGYPHIKVIIMSLFDDYMLKEDFAMRGVKGFVSKAEAVSDMAGLYSIIRKVSKGGTYINYDKDQGQRKLSVRQKQIVGLVGEGKSSRAIAGELGMTQSGINKQLKKIMRQMGVKSFSELCFGIAEKGLRFFRKSL